MRSRTAGIECASRRSPHSNAAPAPAERITHSERSSRSMSGRIPRRPRLGAVSLVIAVLDESRAVGSAAFQAVSITVPVEPRVPPAA